ncbi:MAG: tetratricopeptide repeat protein, partial [Desulfobulbaceae bacterium]|nr:tetratricopeptide repeat protein [Desulfobulbaceae bacterium]
RYCVSCLASGIKEEAKRGCLEALVISSGHCQELLALGGHFYEHALKEHAALCFERAREANGDSFEAHYNLGLIRYEQGMMEEALSLYRRAALINPDDPDLLFNMGLALVALGEYTEALLCCHELLRQKQSDVHLLVLMADCYRKLFMLDESIVHYRSALALAPFHGPAWAGLGVVFHQLNLQLEAIQAFTNARDAGHDPEGCAHMLAALTGTTPEKPPESYVEKLFDSFAENFDDKLIGQLGYSVPNLIRAEMGKLLPSGPSRLLDLGCGTGLVGEVFCGWAGEIHGVDISAGMLNKAKEKGHYHSLYRGDIVAYLKSCSKSFDLIVAADVLNYIGELKPFFRAVMPVLSDRGKLVVSVESGEIAEGNYALQTSGRYAHKIDYLQEVAEMVGLQVEFFRDAKIRMEKGAWLMGHLVCLSPSAG